MNSMRSMYEMTKKKNYRRELYLDVIRVLAAFLVIYTHTGDIGSKLYVFNDYGALRNGIYIMTDVIRCINVPLFFMVSGALLLRKKESYKDLFQKRILKYAIILMVMSYFYFVVFYGNKWNDFALFFEQLCTRYVTGLYWFLYEYIGYLLILPFLRKIVAIMEKKDFQYLLIMGVLFKGILHVATGILGWGNILIPFRISVDAIFYPVMGDYIANLPCDLHEESSRIKKNIIIGFVASCICFFAATYMVHWEAYQLGGYSESRETYLASFNVIPTLYIFYAIRVWCVNLHIPPIVSKVFHFIGENSFGIYLFSIFAQVKMLFIHERISAFLPNVPLISCIIYILIIMLIEAAAVSLLRKIPCMKRII